MSRSSSFDKRKPSEKKFSKKKDNSISKDQDVTGNEEDEL